MAYIHTETGRPFSDLDELLCHMGAKQLVGDGCGYTVVSADGHKMLGMVPSDTGAPIAILDTPFWRKA